MSLIAELYLVISNPSSGNTTCSENSATNSSLNIRSEGDVEFQSTYMSNNHDKMPAAKIKSIRALPANCAKHAQPISRQMKRETWKIKVLDKFI